MLENIKSLYIFKKIFNHLFEGNKLKIIRFRKKLQKRLNFTILYYKLWCLRKYEQIEEGKDTEFFYDNNSIYMGDYLYNKKIFNIRNGKGKEYNKEGKLKFEGEYLYNHRIKGKEYYNNGQLSFEGEYFSHKKWNGKGYDINGNISYELNNGTGSYKYFDNNDNLISEGEYINGKKMENVFFMKIMVY